MVFFTCNHCGESLKKPTVEKHYQWKSCKGAPPFLTCVDCLKDFRGEEYKAHIKCITEDEKYSAKGFVAKPDKNKGAQKQEAWTEIIQNHLLNTPGIDAHSRRTLEKIATQSNVPRKKAKFINFIKNSLRISPNAAEQIWAIVEEALADFNGKIEKEKAEKQAEKRKLDEEKAAAAAAGTENSPKKKKKKTKRENGVEEENGTAEELEPAKKKKKKNHSEEETNGAEETNGHDTSAVFEWDKVILKLLNKNNEMEVDKLKSKVLKKYTAPVTVKVEKRFLKKLKGLENVEINGKIVKLVE